MTTLVTRKTPRQVTETPPTPAPVPVSLPVPPPRSISRAAPTLTPNQLIDAACAALGANRSEVFESNRSGNLVKSEAITRRHVFLAAIRMGIALNCPANLSQLGAATGMCHSSISMMMASRLSDTPPKVTVRDVIEAVCAEMGLTPDMLASSARNPSCVWGRRITVMLSRKLTLASYPNIAKAIGQPNHSSTISSSQDSTRVLKRDRGDPTRTIGGRDAADIMAAVEKRLESPQLGGGGRSLCSSNQSKKHNRKCLEAFSD